MDGDFLDPEVRDSYIMLRTLPDGRLCGVHQLMFHWTLHVDIDEVGYADKYCFKYLHDAILALLEWDGTGDPGDRWHRHLKTGRRCNLETGQEWIAP